MNRFLLLIATLTSTLYIGPVMVQFNYNFTRLQNQGYVPLVGALSLTRQTCWNSDFDTIIALPFLHSMHGGTSKSMLYIDGSTFLIVNGLNPKSGFGALEICSIGRGTLPGGSKSEIGYVVSGMPRSRVFKIEFSNADFEDELLLKQSLNESVSFQV